ncbi:hypothetical protein Leryth_020723 [Lithospermum erythrorhizon]|nr:hypothetical protein Leryth_020723 [Lithospermum erythrorhizon]
MEYLNSLVKMATNYCVSFSFISNKKVLHLGLWLIWLCGFLLIALSFYATQMLPSSFVDQMRNPQFIIQSSLAVSGGPTIDIFTAPRPFVGIVGERQGLAVRSWLGLSAKITVVLFSQEPSVFSFSDSVGSRVSVEPNIDFT